MLMRLRLSAVVLVAMVATQASAAHVQYILDTSVAGQFKVFAQASAGDNGGLVTFGVPLTGADTIENMAPFTLFAQNATFQGGTAGFSELRSGANVTPVAGGQNIIGPTPHLIYGFGQESSSFAAKGLNALSPPNVDSWDAKLLLVQGTHSGNVAIDTSNVNFLADVFAASGDSRVMSATVEACVNACGSLPPVIVPQNVGPTALAVINAQLQATGDGPITWSNLTPASGSPAAAATLSNTGAFQWHTIGSARPGVYSWNATATNGSGSDTGLAITVELVVPEPASMVLVSLAVVGLVGLARRRK